MGLSKYETIRMHRVVWWFFFLAQNHSRRSLRSVGVLLLSLLLSLGGDIILHLPVITSFVSLGHFLELPFFLAGHRLQTHGGREGREPGSDPAPACPLPPGGAAAAGAALTFHRSEHLRENSAKLTDESGCFFLCSSRHVCTK